MMTLLAAVGGDVVPLLAAVSDQVWLALITLGTGIVAVIGAALTGYIALRQRALDTTLQKQDEKIDSIAVVANATYTFQNHAMGLQKRALMVACQAKAKLDATPENIKEAEVATRGYEEHQRGQAKVDAQALITRAEEQARKVLQDEMAKHPPLQVIVTPDVAAEPETSAVPAAAAAAAAAEEKSVSHEIKGVIELKPAVDKH